MLDVYDLKGFVDKLGDLTRAAEPMEIVVEACELLDDNPVRRFLMQRRAAAAADAHYLHGIPMRRIAKTCGVTSQAVRNWIDDYGPMHYLSIERVPTEAGAGYDYVLRLVAMDRDDQVMKRRLAGHRFAGQRIVPAGFNLVDPHQPDGITSLDQWSGEPSQLWEQLGD